MLKRDQVLICLNCKKPFKRGYHPKTLTCSISCGVSHAHAKKIKTIYRCEVCGSVRPKRYKTCSMSCGAVLRHKEQGNPRWRTK